MIMCHMKMTDFEFADSPIIESFIEIEKKVYHYFLNLFLIYIKTNIYQIFN